MTILIFILYVVPAFISLIYFHFIYLGDEMNAFVKKQTIKFWSVVALIPFINLYLAWDCLKDIYDIYKKDHL